MEALVHHLRHFGDKLISLKLKFPRFLSKKKFVDLMLRVKSIGLVRTMEEFDQRKLTIFNQLNFFQLITGFLMSVAGLISIRTIPLSAWFVALLPAMVSLLVLYLNKIYKHEAALLVYFLLHPFVTCVVYLYGLNLGISLYFIFYGILAVFFLRDIGYAVFSLAFSILSYFILSIVLKHYWYDLEILNNKLYLVNHFVALGFIFCGLFLVKKESSNYQSNILGKNNILRRKNEHIIHQSVKLEENAVLLKKQAEEMAALNSLKNKLFSVISHDLKAPLYALRNLFDDVNKSKMSAADLKNLVPEVLNDLNFTVGLMDNLLQWTKTQMQSETVCPQQVEIEDCIQEVLQQLHLQSKAKQISIQNGSGAGLYGYADKNMISLVLRNLVSNAIKFTPEKGNIHIGVHDHETFLEIFVKDSGIGISLDELKKINSNTFYTKRGTASETGTGLGLMLCKEFIARNGGQLHIESEPGEGSTFSFTIPSFNQGN